MNVVNSNGKFNLLSMELCVMAKDHAESRARLSPFAKAYNEHKGSSLMGGGKNDDISVIAVRVV